MGAFNAGNNKNSPSLSTKLATLVIDEEFDGSEFNLTASSPVQDTVTETLITAECKTPTAKEYRIPETTSCPPAPRKRKGSKPMTASVTKKLKILSQYCFASPTVESTLGFRPREFR